MKSGKTSTADNTLLRKITWPYKAVYTSSGRPSVYEEMSISLFVSGYLMVIAGEKCEVKPYMIEHLQELMDELSHTPGSPSARTTPYGCSNWKSVECIG